MTVEIRPFRSGDAPGLAALVRRCLREVNGRDYPVDAIDRMSAHFTPGRFVELARIRRVYVADDGGRPVGTVSRDGGRVYTLFVDPDRIGQGIGRRLLRHVEDLAAREGHAYMETGASITAHSFYLRLGYGDVRESDAESVLRKPLSPR
ncbi:GNAT family N-acetyltransferase [Actinomadura algeriensis]|uniref:Acetyltransferase n=1 Tax=Actinomadura algeriensis TaxID=1679523 RepID=A0ABR9JPZ4_9ACTN|nr:GNAT family N-acetyltransferase [Actinomadura algeriensis]MBE1532639.1 putative acetyltransferase [Actinomadura algeriensis]